MLHRRTVPLGISQWPCCDCSEIPPKLVSQAARQRKAIRDNIASRQVTIAEQLALEEVAHNKDMAAREAERLVSETFQREMGVAAVEQRTERYLLKSTTEHVTMLDPTGEDYAMVQFIES